MLLYCITRPTTCAALFNPNPFDVATMDVGATSDGGPPDHPLPRLGCLNTRIVDGSALWCRPVVWCAGSWTCWCGLGHHPRRFWCWSIQRCSMPLVFKTHKGSFAPDPVVQVVFCERRWCLLSDCLDVSPSSWCSVNCFSQLWFLVWLQICWDLRVHKFWIVSAVLEGCFVLFQEKIRIMVLCYTGFASKPLCRRVGLFDLVRCLLVRWTRKGWLCCCIWLQGPLVHDFFRCWPLILTPLKMYPSHPWLTGMGLYGLERVVIACCRCCRELMVREAIRVDDRFIRQSLDPLELFRVKSIYGFFLCFAHWGCWLGQVLCPPSFYM